MGETRSTGDAAGAQQIVASLRTTLSGGDREPVTAALARLDALEAALSRVLGEHSGMADELLRVYEQLGVVFEVTRQLPAVHDEAEVLRLFAASLRTTYPNAQVTTLGFGPDGLPTPHGSESPLPPWVCSALARCRDERRVVVAQCPDCEQAGESPPGRANSGGEPCRSAFGQVMCGPIHAGDALVCALLLAHESAAKSDLVTQSFEASDMLLLDSLSSFCGDMIRNFRLLSEVRQLSVDMVRVLINTIEQKDEYTSGHSTRVGHYATLLGRELELDAAALQTLEWSALLHDVGKIGIRDEVLKKPGKLTTEEFQHIKEHPVRSYQVVQQVPQMAAALDGIVHHHEHWDGSGYPDGLAGEEIPLPARIIQVADIFDALTSTRSYRKAFDWQKALDILEADAGETVDPHVSRVFGRLMRRVAAQEPEKLEQIMSVRRADRDSASSERLAVISGGQKLGDA